MNMMFSVCIKTWRGARSPYRSFGGQSNLLVEFRIQAVSKG